MIGTFSPRCAQRARRGEAVHDRHLHVHQNHVEALLQRHVRPRPDRFRHPMTRSPTSSSTNRTSSRLASPSSTTSTVPAGIPRRPAPSDAASAVRVCRLFWAQHAHACERTRIERHGEHAALCRLRCERRCRRPAPRAKRRLMVKPSPVPPKRRVVELSACVKGSKTASSWSGGMPIPVSITSIVSMRGPAVRAQAQRPRSPRPLSVNLIALPTRLVTICRTRDGSVRTVSGTAPGAFEVEARCLSPAPAPTGSRPPRRMIACGAHAHALELQAPGLDLGQIENVVDQLEQMLAAASGSCSDACVISASLLW